jgi:hypothetical protein
MTDYPRLLRALASHGVEFIVVGGAAATAHGAARLTLDLDVVYRRTPDNMERVVACMTGLDPYLRGAPPGLHSPVPYTSPEAAPEAATKPAGGNRKGTSAPRRSSHRRQPWC